MGKSQQNVLLKVAEDTEHEATFMTLKAATLKAHVKLDNQAQQMFLSYNKQQTENAA